MSIQTLSELFLEAARHDKPDCLMHKVSGKYVSISTAQLVDHVHRLAAALAGAGVAAGDRVALMAENGPHWPTVDFATLSIGAVLVPIYPTLTPEQAAFIARDCGARILFVQGQERLDGLLGVRAEIPDVERIVAIGGDSDAPGVTRLEAMVGDVSSIDPLAFEARARAVGADDLATFIYTSGTTGDPKGVMLTHRNVTSNVIDSLARMDIPGDWTALSFLPLSHSFERTVDYIYFYRGVTIAYAESVATVAQNMQEVRPHVFVAVPRVYEKVLSRVQENVAAGSPLKQKIFHWAASVGREALPWRLQLESPPGLLGIKLALADKLVFTKIRERLGGRFQFAMSGGAPLARDVAEFFWGAGVEIYEGYGLSETSPVLTVNGRGAVRLGTVGMAIRNVELRIAEDGEILARGPNIMRGYWGREKDSAEVLEADGWFHTGDIGELDGDGFLAITDRKKEILVNAYGKNIAPAPIEGALKSSPYVGHAVVLGDRRKFVAALLVPDFENLLKWAAKAGLDTGDPTRLLADSQVRKLYGEEIARVNKRLAPYEQIKAWDLLAEDFTIESGELTPTLKVKRRVVNTRYAEVIDRLYQAIEQHPTGVVS